MLQVYLFNSFTSQVCVAGFSFGAAGSAGSWAFSMNVYRGSSIAGPIVFSQVPNAISVVTYCFHFSLLFFGYFALVTSIGRELAGGDGLGGVLGRRSAFGVEWVGGVGWDWVH